MENKCAIAGKQFLKQLHRNPPSLVILVTGLKIRRNQNC